jgi:hypothetical protein
LRGAKEDAGHDVHCPQALVPVGAPGTMPVPDLNQLAARLVQQATDESEPKPESAKARAGREGGKKGGRTRAERLSPDERSEIARKAAQARWRRKS